MFNFSSICHNYHFFADLITRFREKRFFLLSVFNGVMNCIDGDYSRSVIIATRRKKYTRGDDDKKIVQCRAIQQKVFRFFLYYGRHRYQTATNNNKNRLLVQKESTKNFFLAFLPPTLRLTTVQRNFSSLFFLMLNDLFVGIGLLMQFAFLTRN